jgi:hypothetical protein
VTSTWWAPGERDWWIGVLFAIGSGCFAVGAAPRYVDAVGVSTDGVTFFVGSLFFTSAAFLLCLDVTAGAPLDRWAAGVQLVGTLLFNLSTFDAMRDHLSATQADRLVWTPDALGSICFLVASGLAWLTAGHAVLSWRPRSLPWTIAALNLAGSIAFGASAVASHVVTTTDQVRNVTLMNLGTFVGALCFLVGGVLLLPARTAAGDGSATRT